MCSIQALLNVVFSSQRRTSRIRNVHALPCTPIAWRTIFETFCSSLSMAVRRKCVALRTAIFMKAACSGRMSMGPIPSQPNSSRPNPPPPPLLVPAALGGSHRIERITHALTPPEKKFLFYFYGRRALGTIFKRFLGLPIFAFILCTIFHY